MNLQRQDVTNVTVTYVTKFSVQNFETIALKPLQVFANSSKLYIVEVNCQMVFAKLLFKTSQRSCIRYALLLVFYYI